jgi:hypothetical protein
MPATMMLESPDERHSESCDRRQAEHVEDGRVPPPTRRFVPEQKEGEADELRRAFNQNAVPRPVARPSATSMA